MTNSISEETARHPRPLDHNRAILWARHLVASSDWLILATKSTAAAVRGEEAAVLVSLALLSPAGEVLLETFIKPSGAINGEAITKHGLDSQRAFNAISYDELKVLLKELVGDKQALSWNLDDQNCLLESYAVSEKTTPLAVHGQSLMHQYARFIGQWTESGYKSQELPEEAHKSALAECQAVLSTIRWMASKNQLSDSLATGNEGWTAEFFKPKLTPVDRLKGFFKP